MRTEMRTPLPVPFVQAWHSMKGCSPPFLKLVSGTLVASAAVKPQSASLETICGWESLRSSQ